MFDVKFQFNLRKNEKNLGKGENLLTFNKAPENDDNVSHVKSQTRQFAPGAYASLTGTTGTIYGSGKRNNTVIHETLHLLGLSDRYDDLREVPLPKAPPSIPHKGYEKDIMANSNNNTLTLAQYEQYLQAAQYQSKYHRSDVHLFKIYIDRNAKRQLLTPFEPGGIHKYNPYAEQ